MSMTRAQAIQAVIDGAKVSHPNITVWYEMIDGKLCAFGKITREKQENPTYVLSYCDGYELYVPDIIVEGWINVYSNCNPCFHESREKADRMANVGRVACSYIKHTVATSEKL